MNHRGIPHIDPITFELEWYVEESIFNQEMNEGNSRFMVHKHQAWC